MLYKASCTFMTGKSIDFFLLFIFALTVSSSSLQAQSFTFNWLPTDPPQPGDIASLKVSATYGWESSGNQPDTLLISHHYSGFSINPDSDFSIDSTADWLNNQLWYEEVELLSTNRELIIRLIFPNGYNGGEAGFVLRLKGIEIEVDDFILRKASTNLSNKPNIEIGQKKINVQAVESDFLKRIALYTFSGQRLWEWNGHQKQMYIPAPVSGILSVYSQYHQIHRKIIAID